MAPFSIRGQEMNDMDEAKKFLTPEEYEQYIQAQNAKGIYLDVPKKVWFNRTETTKPICEKILDDDGILGNSVEITKEMLEYMVSLQNDGFAIDLKVFHNGAHITGERTSFLEEHYNSAVVAYNSLKELKEQGSSNFKRLNDIIECRKSKHVEHSMPNLPNTIAELQALVVQLMAKNN